MDLVPSLCLCGIVAVTCLFGFFIIVQPILINNYSTTIDTVINSKDFSHGITSYPVLHTTNGDFELGGLTTSQNDRQFIFDRIPLNTPLKLRIYFGSVISYEV